MDGDFTPMYVSHCQMLVIGGPELADLPLYSAGDTLLVTTGSQGVTIHSGLHSGQVLVRAAEVDGPPPPDPAWPAESEATIHSPEGRVLLMGLMGDTNDELGDLVSGGPGLYRVRVRARHRRREVPGEEPPPEEYEVLLWRTDADTGTHTFREDDLYRLVDPDSAKAAVWAAQRLVAAATPSPERRNLLTHGGRRPLHPGDPLPRVAVRRIREGHLGDPAVWLGAEPEGEDLVIPLGPLRIRLRQLPAPQVRPAGRDAAARAEAAEPEAQDAAAGSRGGRRVVFGWRWEAAPGVAAEPADDAESLVDLRAVTWDPGGPRIALRHTGLRAADAVLTGLLWEHLLERAAAGPDPAPLPWLEVFRAQAERERAAAEALRRRVEATERAEWGGRSPSDRLRGLPANTWGLRQLDADLVHGLATLPDDRQREVARWAARQAFAVSGLDGVGWLADLLSAVERDDAPPFDDLTPIWDRMLEDPDVPQRLVTSPTGTPNCLQQAMALPALFAAAEDDPLVGAVDAIYAAAIAYGDTRTAFLADLRTAFPDVGPPG